MARHWQYLKYVLRHKLFVLLAGLKLHVPIIMLIVHDWDKFLPDEWFPYARTFYAPDGSKQYVESVDFARAWMLHQHRNKHHWQYWLWLGLPADNTAIPLRDTNCLVWDRGQLQYVDRADLHDPASGEYIAADPMPDVFRREMLADWYGAGRALGFPDTGKWYRANAEKMKLHPDTRQWIEDQLMTPEQQAIWNAGIM